MWYFECHIHRNCWERATHYTLVRDALKGVCFFLQSSLIPVFVNAGPPRMSPKSQRTPRPHRVASCRGGGPPPPDYMSQGASVEVSAPPPTRNSPSGGTWSSVVSGGK